MLQQCKGEQLNSFQGFEIGHISYSSLKSQVGLLQTAHSWANALLGARVRLRVAVETIG